MWTYSRTQDAIPRYLRQIPLGRGSFSAGLRCEKLVMGGIAALSAPNPAKKWLPPKP